MVYFNVSCAFWSGEPSSDLCHVCNSQPERPEGLGLHRCTVSGGLPGSRGCLFGPAEKRTHQQLCEQGQPMSDLRIAFSIFEALRRHVTISILWNPLPQGSLGLECRSGPGHRGSVHLSDGLHCVCSMWPETEGVYRTRKPGHWIGTFNWSAIRGQNGFFFHTCFFVVASAIKKSQLVVRLYR